MHNYFDYVSKDLRIAYSFDCGWQRILCSKNKNSESMGRKFHTKKLNIMKTMLTALCLLVLSLSTYATPIKLLNNPDFEPIQINNSVNINTTTSNTESIKSAPKADVPIPHEINKAFSSSQNIPLADTKSVNSYDTNSIEKSLPKEITEDFFTPIETSKPVLSNEKYTIPPNDENSFDTFKPALSPSEYKNISKQTLPEEEQLPKSEHEQKTLTEQSQDVQQATQTFTPEDNSDYYATAEENILDTTDYNGKIISEIKICGLRRVDKSVPISVISSKENTVFNENTIQQDLQSIYNIGYFTDNIYVEPELTEEGQVSVKFILEENIVVSKVEMVGNDVITAKELGCITNQMEGLPQNLGLINETIEKINKYYAEKGYILAKVTDVEDNADGKLIFHISEGLIDEIKLEGNKKTKDYIIQRNILTQTGSVYNEDIFKKDLAKIYNTQIFETVDRKIEETENKGHYIVTVVVKEDSSNNIKLSAGLDNALGVFGSVGYNEKNLFGRNQKFSVSGLIGSGALLSDSSIINRMNYQIDLNFFEPHFLNENNSLAGKVYFRELGSFQVPLAIERRMGINAMLEHRLEEYTNLSTTLGLGYEYINLKEGDFNKISELYREQNIDISKRKEQLAGGSFFNVAPGIKYSTLDDDMMPRNGMLAKANFVEAFGLSDSKQTNGRLIGGITKYIPIAKKSTILFGVKGGVKVHGNNMPEVMAFKLGGPYTVRGFRMNGVGSGNSFIMGSVEMQTPIPLMDKLKYDIFKNLRLAFFVDAGRVFSPTITSKLYDRPLSAISAGVGLRINIPSLGPISIDYGLPLTNTGKYGPNSGYFTFGTGGLYDNY